MKHKFSEKIAANFYSMKATEGLAASLRHKYKILFFANLKTDLKSATCYLFYFHFLLGKAIDEIDELVGISLSLSFNCFDCNWK